MMTERIAWEFESAPAREQIRLRNKGRRGASIIKPFEREILDAKPQGTRMAEVVLHALDELGSCRPVTMAGLGRIPATAIWMWLDRRGYRGMSARIMEHGIIEADRAFVAENAKRASES